MNEHDLAAADLIAYALDLLPPTENRSARALADAIGLTGRDQDRTVSNWMSGVSKPNYRGTLRLLTFVGLLPRELPARVIEDKPWQMVPVGWEGPIRWARGVDEEELAAAIHEIATVLERLQRLADEQGPPQSQGTADA